MDDNYPARYRLLLIEKPRLSRISNLALPIIAGALATNLMTLVDTLMVGQLGDAALGGVGIAGQLFFLLLAGVLGLAAGVQAIVARRVGQGRLNSTGQVLNAGILLASVLGLGLIAVGYFLLPPVLELISKDLAVTKASLAYLSTRLPSILLIGINVSFRAYWVGVSLAKWSMVSIVALSLANILFNYMLIFGNFGAPQMGVAGAGLGSTLAVFLGLLVNLSFGLKLATRNGFLKTLPNKEQLAILLRVSYPESLRQALFSAGVVLLYILIGQIGTRELAAFHVAISICLIAYMPHIGIGGAATTLVGEALGRGDTSDAKLWGWQVSAVSFWVLSCLALFVVIQPGVLLGWFIRDGQTLALAILPLQLAVLGHVLDGYSKVMGLALIGAGATAAAMKLSLIPQWLLLLPLVTVAVFLGHGLVSAMAIFLASTLLSATLMVYYWRHEKWQAIVL